MAGPHDELIPHYVDYLRQRSALLTHGTEGAFELAAHLFAVAQQLVDDAHDFERLEPSEQIILSLEELGSILARLSRSTRPLHLYRLLTDGLTLIQEAICRDHDDGRSKEVEIAELGVGDRRLLGGRVLCWVRRPRVFRQLRQQGFETKRRAGVSLPPPPIEHPSNHLDRLFCFWKRSNQRPRVRRAEPRDAAAPALRAGQDLGAGVPFRIALCPLVGKAHPRFDLTEDRSGFRACVHTPMVEPEGHAVREQLAVILEQARSRDIHVLVLPELCVDVATRDWLFQTLGTARSKLPLAVVAGSFHVDRPGISRPFNETRLVDDTGNRLLEHQKRGRFCTTPVVVKRGLEGGSFCDLDGLRDDVDKLRAEIQEHIEPGEVIELLELGVGQLAVLICADAIDTRDRPELRDAVIQLRPDFVIVPSMTPETELFEGLATTLERIGVSTFFVNAHCFCPKGEVLAAVCLDLYRGKDDPPTRVRWRRGCEPEEWIRKPVAGADGHWREFDPAGSPVDWLAGRAGERLGLIIDLGAYWRGGRR